VATKKKKLIPKANQSKTGNDPYSMANNFLTDTPPSNGMPTEGIARINKKPKGRARRRG
jgi:hypothetical protein